jgi:hypothetical protein
MFRRLVHSVVPLNKLKFTFVKSSGPGGQNVNKSKPIGNCELFSIII